MKNTSIIILISILFFSVPAFASATHTWTGGIGGDWGLDGNWLGDEPDADTSVVYVNNGTATVSLLGEIATSNFHIGYSGVTPDDGTVRIATGGDLTVGASGPNTFIGNAGKGTLEIAGGTYNSLVGIIMGDESSGEGTINLNGGLFNTSSIIMVGNYGTGTITQTDGTFNGQVLTLGDVYGSSGPLVVSGGGLAASL